MYRFSHVGIVVENMEDSVDFYTGVLGCKIHKQHRDENIQFTLLKADNQEIELLNLFSITNRQM